jgi:membrane protein
MKIKTIGSILKASLNHWQNHRASRMGAALSYYTIFSIVPLLTLVLVVIGSYLGNSYTQTAIVEEVRNLVNAQGANFVQSIMSGLGEMKFSFFSIIVNIGILVVGTLGVFYELKNSLDDLWDTKQETSEMKSWRYFFSSRLLSLSIIPILGFLLIISLVFGTLLGLVSEYSPALAQMTSLFKVGTFIFSFFVLNFLFIFIYRFLPKRKLPWRELVRGALVTTVLFVLGKFLVSVYIANFSGTSVFGATEVFVVMLLWGYYSIQIFLYGASLTYVYSRRFGHLKDQ